MGNAFLDKQRAKEQAMLEIGMEVGFQKCWDLMQITLRDPEAVGTDIFGQKRIKKIHKVLAKHEADLGKAFLPISEKEADVKQRDMDKLLMEIWGDELCPFHERYPQIKPISYKKGRKQWRDD